MKKSTLYIFIFSSYLLILLIILLASGLSSPPKDILNLATLLFEIIIFPATIFSLAMAAESLRKSTEIPLLNLEWDNKQNSNKKHISIFNDITDKQKISLPIYLYNRGENIAVWYSISIEIPRIVHGFDKNILLKDAIEIVFGNENNWQIEIRERYYKLIFQSNGQQASYPFEMNELAYLKIPNPNDLYSERERIAIPYYINTDKGLSCKNYLYIDLSSP